MFFYRSVINQILEIHKNWFFAYRKLFSWKSYKMKWSPSNSEIICQKQEKLSYIKKDILYGIIFVDKYFLTQWVVCNSQAKQMLVRQYNVFHSKDSENSLGNNKLRQKAASFIRLKIRGFGRTNMKISHNFTRPYTGITIPRNYPERAIMSQNDPERAIMTPSEP